MAIDVMTWVWSHSKSRHGARLVLLAVADSMNSAHAWAWPSTAELARKTNLTGRAVQTAVADLVKLRELEVGYNTGPRGCNRYRVLTTPEKISPPQNLHPPAESSPPDVNESGQVSTHDPEESSPPAESSPPKKTASDPEESSPGTVRNRKRTKKSVRDEPPREDVDRICKHLADRIEGRGSKRPNITLTWRREARLLLDADKRTEEQVHAAIDWCQGNAFWCSKVMSLPKLREKYDVLRLEAKRERDGDNGTGPRSRHHGDPQAPSDYRREWERNRG